MRLFVSVLLWAMIMVVPAGTARALAADASDTSASPAGLPYVVRFEGPLSPENLALLKAVSKAETLRQSPPDSVLLLMRRADEDKTAFGKVFQSDGHFAATVTSDIDTEASPAVLTYRIDPGPRFTLREVTLRLAGGDPGHDAPLPSPADIGLTVPSPFEAKAILDAEAKIGDILHRKAYPFATVPERSVTANFADKAVTVVWTVRPGPRTDFGPTRFSGLTSVKESYLARLIPWQPGQPYDADTVARYRATLSNLDLFSVVQIEPQKELEQDGRVPIKVTVAERKHRTIKAGVDYKTDEGPGANLGWEHRNLFGGGEKLSFKVNASAIEQSWNGSFEKPDLITPKELFKANVKVTNEDKKAYKGQSAQITGAIRRQFTDVISGTAGLGYRASRIEEDQSRPWENEKRYGFVFVPLEANIDTRNDKLDPQRGIWASLSFAPYWGTLANGPDFLRPEASLAHYIKLLDKPGVVLATRATAGANLGVNREDVPPDLRFYAGGAGSVRGYAYQSVGPRRGTTPLGGGSMYAFSTELRIRVTELVGVVPFLDGGTANTNQLPPYHQAMLLGAGLGIRIFTPIGPVRFDVATPLTRRKDDAIAQFYFSIGQSF